jgi:hypothetical protein
MHYIWTRFNLKREYVVWHKLIRFHRSLVLMFSIVFCGRWDITFNVVNRLLSGWPRIGHHFLAQASAAYSLSVLNVFILPSFPTGLCVSMFVSAFDNLIYSSSRNFMLTCFVVRVVNYLSGGKSETFKVNLIRYTTKSRIYYLLY